MPTLTPDFGFPPVAAATGVPTSTLLFSLILVLLAGLPLPADSAENPGIGIASAGPKDEAPAPEGTAQTESFCAQLPRPAWAALQRRDVGEWFEVAEIEPGVWALYEPWQWQEVISYLIVGRDSALLFDTGNGIGDIRSAVRAITDRPLRVLNSHSHYDHVGGNHQFTTILAPPTDFSRQSADGLPHGAVAEEVSAQALCRDLPAGVKGEEHRIRPYEITGAVSDGEVIDLGGISLEVVMLPGHTPDALGLLDRERGYFWSGDSFYEGPIWLFMPETDLAAYRGSVARMAELAPRLNTVFPSHNTPRAAPQRLVELRDALDSVVSGHASAIVLDDGRLEFSFAHFSLLLAKDQLDAARIP